MAKPDSLSHAQLVEAAYKWVLRETRCQVAFKEAKTVAASGEEPDVIAFGAFGMSIVIECKASRADFLADAKKIFRQYPEMGMGRKRYYCCPENLLTQNELPRLWGLVYVSAETGKSWVAYDPGDEMGGIERLFERNINAEMAVMYSALRKMSFYGGLKGVDVSGQGRDDVSPGQTWHRKDRPNQTFEVAEFSGGLVRLRSKKTGMIENVPILKLKKLYQLSAEGT